MTDTSTSTTTAGNNEANVIFGLEGNDHLLGMGGNDWLSGTSGDVLVPNAGLITMEDSTTLNFSFGHANENSSHTIGVFVVDPETNVISSVEVIWDDASVGNEMVEQNFQVDAGLQVGFFVLNDGFNLNDYVGLGDGTFAFASNEQGGLEVVHIDGSGATTALTGDVLLSTQAQTATGAIVGQSNLVEIGFEDSWGGNDGDFNDVVFSVNVGEATAEALAIATPDEGDDRIEGREGEDTIIGADGNDLLVGGGAGTEWQLIEGEWVFDATAIAPLTGASDFVWDESDDLLVGGDGQDVLLGNRGDDILRGGGGDDILNGGRGFDQVLGGDDNDILNLEDGNDLGIGGDGQDIINAGNGHDTLYGDLQGQNLIMGQTTAGVEQLGASGDWSYSTDLDGTHVLSQSINTVAGQDYTFSLDLAANLKAGFTGGQIEVFWNGELIDEVDVSGALFETLATGFKAEDDSGILEIRSTANADDDTIDTSGPIARIEVSLTTADGTYTTAGFAPGQNNLYQVMDGQLNVFDPTSMTYSEIGDDPGFRTNAIGYNIEDNLLYAIVGNPGTDSQGNSVAARDLVAYDAEGNTFRIGTVDHRDFVGDFDDDGNLWTFNSSINRITMIDVDQILPDGSVHTVDFDIDPDLFPYNIYDVAFDTTSQSFYALRGAPEDGGVGYFAQIDISDVMDGGDPVITTSPVTGTLNGADMSTGLPVGAFGAVFMDGDGRFYASLNSGNHDLDADTADTGSIFEVIMDPVSGTGHIEHVADAVSTSYNDGATDPRGTNTFGGIDTTASLVIQNIALSEDTGDGDQLRGAAGDDSIYGGGGDDLIHAGDDQDLVHGDAGRDIIFGGQGDDELHGGTGNDHIEGGVGKDVMDGGTGNDALKGEEGSDQLDGGYGDDVAYGGADADDIDLGQGDDRGFGGTGADKIDGGAGDDHLEGGSGDDNVIGDQGSDFLKGADGNDFIVGGEGNDNAYGGQGDDDVAGGAGDDRLYGNAGDDNVVGGDGNDIVRGGDGDDMLAAGGGDDLALGGDGNDFVVGGAGDDKIVGGAGEDIIAGGAGTDHLWGGTFAADNSSDIFVYNQGGGKDLIHDFESDLDRIDLSSYGMTFEELSGRISDLGWAAEIDLTDLPGANDQDRIVIRSVTVDELGEDNFIL